MTGPPSLQPGSRVRQQDWEGRDLSGTRQESVELVEVDVTDVVATGARWVDSTFRDCRFTGASFTRTALTGCTSIGCDLAGVTFTDCTLVGSRFGRCRYDRLTVQGGDWSFAGLRGADLRRTRFTG
ncbi:MAG: pentapeptide repeat-containing protein, partial [Actinomycetota bacterium]|nr:pentapeptide repeat-containing protein [Actinomycetota bacterium]